MNQKSSIMK